MKKTGFTLAEMMVVMLILSIIMAAFAPIMTRRSKADMNNRSPWQYVDGENSGNIYFNAAGDSVVAMLGAKLKTADLATPRGKFIINASSGAPYALRFQYDGVDSGFLTSSPTSVEFGNDTIGSINFRPDGNIGIGLNALENLEPSTSANFQNIAIGNNALRNTTVYGGSNIAIGMDALSTNSYGGDNVALGYNALMTNNDGYANIAIGTQSLLSNNLYNGTPPNNNIAIGKGTLSNNTGAGNIALGHNALNQNNTAHAANAGAHNIAIGDTTLYNNSGANNIAIGEQALAVNMGNNNIAIGQYALKANGSDTLNTQNIAIGTNALTSHRQNTGNVAIGESALRNDLYGAGNIAIGKEALRDHSNGYSNIAIGYQACQYVGNASNKICIGTDSGPEQYSKYTKDGEASKIIYLGDAATTVYIKGGLVVGGNVILNADQGKVVGMREANGHMYRFANVHSDNSAYFSWIYNETTFPYSEFSNFNSTYKSSSDRRLKNISGANNDGLDKLMQLNVFNFTFKQDKKKMPHVGVIAQDLQKVFPNAVMKDRKGYFMIRWDEMFYCMLNSIKELATKVTNIDSRVTKLEKENQALKTQNQMLVIQNKKIQEQNNIVLKRLTRLERKVK